MREQFVATISHIRGRNASRVSRSVVLQHMYSASTEYKIYQISNKGQSNLVISRNRQHYRI